MRLIASWFLAALSGLARNPVTIRVNAAESLGPFKPIYGYFMLAMGDGTPGLKFASTDAYTEDASGRPVYDWTITDQTFIGRHP